MSNNTVKKQNRLMLVALVFILAAATALVAITGTANRKKQNDPPIDGKTEITSDDKNSEKTNGNTNDKTDDKTNDKTDDTAKQGAVVKPGDSKTPVREDDKNSTNTKDSESKPEDKPNESSKDEKTNAGGDAVNVSAEANDTLPVFTTPVDGIVIKGASLTLPVFSYTMNDYRTHGGLDFACSPGTPVYAAADGEVANVVDDPMMGVTVSISHAGGAQTVYKGLGEDTLGMISVGKKVGGGDVIGVSGDTALIESAEENHMHFELSVNGEPKDPSEYMSVVFLSDLTED